jgi:CTP:molybdopterin cytidylyltransferase MocA
MGCPLKGGGGLYERWRIGAVLLAAGSGRRLGGVAKALIRLEGVPLIRRQLIALSGAGVDEVVVVTGDHREAIETAVKEFPVTLAHNAAHAEGQQGSVRVGLAALTGSFNAVLIVLADQPLIGAADLTELIGAFKKRPNGQMLVPMTAGQRGNPVLIDDEARARVLASEANLGCRHLMERHPELVYSYETANRRYLTDIDTAEDLAALSARTGWRFELPA